MGFVAKSTVIIFSFLLFFWPCQVFADSQGHLPGIQGKTIEELIEMTEPEGEAAREKARLLRRGEKTYRQFCVHCHGERGQGKSQTSPYLYPLPRDVTMGVFKFRSTPSNALPRDEDLYRTIRRGVPGTAMPAWGDVLNDLTLRALVEFIKTFSDRFQLESPDFVMPIGLEPAFDRLSIKKGKVLYRVAVDFFKAEQRLYGPPMTNLPPMGFEDKVLYYAMCKSVDLKQKYLQLVLR